MLSINAAQINTDHNALIIFDLIGSFSSLGPDRCGAGCSGVYLEQPALQRPDPRQLNKPIKSKSD